MIITEDAMHDILTAVNSIGISRKYFAHRCFAHIFHQAKDPRPPAEVTPAAAAAAAAAAAGFTPPPPLLG